MLVQGSTSTAGTTTGPQGLPWPTGDPGELRISAQHAAGLGDELDRCHNELLTTGRNIDSWQGTAHAAYASDLERNAAAVETVAGSFRTVRDALIDLAKVLDQAQQVIRHQRDRLAEAREQAQRAAQRAEKARAEAEAAARRAEATAPVTGGADPAAQVAQATAASARSAEAEAAQAREHAEWVEQRAKALAEQEITDVRLMDGRCATLINQAVQNAQAAVAKAGASAQGYNGLNSLGSFFTLFGPIGLTAFGVGKAGMRAYGASKWALYSRGLLALPAGRTLTSMFPTFNNGLVGRKVVAPLLSRVPKAGKAATFFKSASSATPVFRRLGVAGSAVSTVVSAHHVVSKYGWNPVEAYQKGGASYVSDVAKTAFSASSTAFFACPTPVTAGAVAVTGLAWAGTEVWEHHEAIWDGMKDAGGAIADAGQAAWDKATFWN